MMGGMTITEFLLARIAEDERMARAAMRGGDGIWTAGSEPDEDGDVYDEREVFGDKLHIYAEGGHDENQADHIARHDPARVLAECAAKRAIVGEAERLEARAANMNDWGFSVDTLYTLAAIYKDHPDYRQEWMK